MPQINPQAILASLIDEYHSNPKAFTIDQSERLAIQAFQSGIPFRPETKKMKKFMFDLTDTALLGMVPNKWRPKRVGEDLYGESAGEEVAGAIGTLGGLVGGAGIAYKGIQGLGRMGKGLLGRFGRRGGRGGGGGGNTGQHVSNLSKQTVQLPQGTRPLQLGAGRATMSPQQTSLMNIVKPNRGGAFGGQSQRFLPLSRGVDAPYQHQLLRYMY